MLRSILDYVHNHPMFAGLSVNSDGQQCHRYQQYGQRPLNSNHLTQKPSTYSVGGNPGLDLGQAQKSGWLNR